jgi:nicotinamide mononucleotide transporter
MNGQQEWHLFWQQILQTDILTWVAVLLGVAEVLLARANKIALYPTGILGTLLSIYILYRAGLFAECLLNGYYVAMSIYGWWYWVKRRHLPPVKITRSNRRDWQTAIIITGLAFGVLAFALARFTPSTVPYWDAWVSATAWAGMWLLARRKIENWILLNISNAFAIPLLLYKGLPLFAVLTLFLFVVAISGYFQWRKILTRERADPISVKPAPGPDKNITPA